MGIVSSCIYGAERHQMISEEVCIKCMVCSKTLNHKPLGFCGKPLCKNAKDANIMKPITCHTCKSNRWTADYLLEEIFGDGQEQVLAL